MTKLIKLLVNRLGKKYSFSMQKKHRYGQNRMLDNLYIIAIGK